MDDTEFVLEPRYRKMGFVPRYRASYFILRTMTFRDGGDGKFELKIDHGGGTFLALNFERVCENGFKIS